MKHPTAVTALCVLGLASVTVASGNPGPALAPRVLGLDFERQSHPIEKLRRRGHTEIPFYPTNNAWIYVVNVTVGTPPQNVSMQIDTGSSDFWINTPTSTQCTTGNFGCPFGTYSANASSTYQYANSLFSEAYLANTTVSGDFAIDVLNFAGATLKNLTMGIAYESNNVVNLWGIGQPYNEGLGKGLQIYDNSPVQMVQNGLIQSPLYSLWMNAPNATAGSILFGGVDTSKYQGQLTALPVQTNPSGKYDFPRVNLASISLNGGSVTTNVSEFPQTAVLDTGNPLNIVPMDTFQAIVNMLNISMVQSNLAFCPCSLASSAVTFTFQFAGVNISVPISSLVSAPNALALQAYTHGAFPVPESGTCVLMIVPMELTRSNYIVLGDSFLENAYAVYDLANNIISLAQANFNPASSNVVEIPAGAGGVAAALQAAGTGTPTTTGATGTPTASASSTSSGSSSPTAKSAAVGGYGGKRAGVVVSGALVGMALVGFL
ncbi:hypothetical protein MMC17_008741 [Xylographa soralifera]|nr:hypothetical protein [Xylographa soralifera]